MEQPWLDSADTTVYKNRDGSYTARVYTHRVNRQAPDGSWSRVSSASTSDGALGGVQPNVADPTGEGDATGTYVESGVTENFYGDPSLFVGTSGGHAYRSLLQFGSLNSQFANAYIISAELWLDTEFTGAGSIQCSSQPVTVAPVAAGWNLATVDTYPGPAAGAQIGSASFSAGVNCPNGRQYEGVPLSTPTLMNWVHGWVPNYGLAVSAPLTDTAFKQFDSGDAFLAIEYTADGAGAAYAETTFASPWNNRTGWAQITVQNEGSATWTSTNGYELGYEIYTVSGGTRTLHSVSNFLTPMPKTVAPNQPVTVTATLPSLTPGPVYQVCWDMEDLGQYFSALGVPQACYALPVVNNPPIVDSFLPGNNATEFTLTPTLSVTAHDVDDYPGTGLTYSFNLYADGNSTPLASVTASTSPSWEVPAGKLSWGGTYYWAALVSDGSATSAWSHPDYFTVPSPAQPLVTAHLGAAPYDSTVRGVEPARGDYSTQVTDASLPGNGIGLPMRIQRTYNSLDPRLDNVFGAGWSSLLDMRATPDQDGSGSIVITLEDGRQERFGRNGDGSFSPPAGLRARLTETTAQLSTGETVVQNYTLYDPSHLIYVFDEGSTDPLTGQSYFGLGRVQDPDGRVLKVIYVGEQTVPLEGGGTAAIPPVPSALTVPVNGSFFGNVIFDFTWAAGRVTTSTGASIAVGHIISVSTWTLATGDINSWTYGYDAANNLTSVCPPTSATACTHYTYTVGASSGSHFTSMVSDSNPSAYWRLNDPVGSTTAADSVAVNEGNDDATLTNVTLGQPGPLLGSQTTSASFNGTSSTMALPDNLINTNNVSIGMWFRTTQAGGVLFSYQGTPAGTPTSTKYVPALYVGTDGKLRGEFWNGVVSPMTSPVAVNDGAWHYVVLSGAANTQTLFLDGAQVATHTGNNIVNTGEPHDTVGAGEMAGSWPAIPTSNPLGFFAGQIEDVSFLRHPLGLPAVQQEYAAGITSASELIGITLPSGKTWVGLTYDNVADRVASVTDADGGTYQFATPVTSGSSDYYSGVVRSTRPTFDYPMDEPSGITAVNRLGVDAPSDSSSDGVYNDVMLGEPGIFGPDGPTGAGFNGTSSYLSLPTGAFDDGGGTATVALWFKTKTPGGVLFSYQSGPIGTALTSGYVPALYVGTDGKLYGEFWDGISTPTVSMNPVTDGNWHMVMLTADSAGGQVLRLDGQLQSIRIGNSIEGTVERFSPPMTTVTIGAGYIGGGSWPARPTSNPMGYFTGEIAQAGVYHLSIEQGNTSPWLALYAAKGSSTSLTPTTALSVTDPAGHHKIYTVDPDNRDRIVSYTDALGQVTRYTYNTLGFQDAVVDPNGHTTTRLHNKYGDVTELTTCQSTTACQSSVFWYHETTDPTDPLNGRITTVVDPRSGLAGAPAMLYKTTYTPTGDVASTITPATPDFPNGRTTTFAYTTGTEPAVDLCSCTEPANLVASITDPRGAVTTFGYDSLGRLAKRTDPSGLVTKYSHDLFNLLVSTTMVSDSFPSGVTTSYTYDSQNRPVTQTAATTTDAVTGVTHTPRATTTYDVDGNVASVEVADQAGADPPRTTAFSYGSNSRLASVADQNGHVTHVNYDVFGNVASRTDAAGDTVTFGYSPTNQLLTTTLTGWVGDPTAPSSPADLVLESRAYDPAGRLASVTDSMGRTTSYAYYDDDRLQSVTIGAGTQNAVVAQSLTYDAAGNLISRCEGWTATDGCASQTDYTVDGADRVTQVVVDPNGLDRVITHTFDADNNILTETRTGGGLARSVSATYDAAGNQVSRTVSDGSTPLTTTWAYDQRGLAVSVTDPRGNVTGTDPTKFTTSAVYDEYGRPVSVSSPQIDVESDGGASMPVVATSLTGYDTFGEVVETDDPNGNIVTNTYDGVGNILASSAPAYTPPGASTSVMPTVTYGYDAVDRLITQTDPVGGVTSLVYDQLGNQVQATLPGARVWHMSVDTDGELLEATDPTGARTQATYNVLGEQVTSTQLVRSPASAAYTTTFQYDVLGNQTSVTDPMGNVGTADYDAVGQVASTTDPLGHTTGYEYNLDGQPTTVTAPDGTAVVNGYDQAGRLVSIADLDASGATLRTASFGYDVAGYQTSATDPNGNTTTATYDAVGRMTGQVQPVATGQSIVTSFGYDAAGNRTRYTDPNGNVTTYTYNTLGLPESSVAPGIPGYTTAADRTTTVGYDASGRAATITRPGGVAVTNTYDDASDLVSQAGSGAEAATATRTFGYDADDRLISASVPGGTDTFTYDDRGLMLSFTGPGATASYDYDADGRLVARTDSAGSATFGYDAASELTSQADPVTGVTVGYTYNALGQLAEVNYGTDGAKRTYGYDSLHQLTSDILKNPDGAVEASTTYGYNDDGQITSRTTAGLAGSGSSTYTYDNAGRLASWNDGADVTAYTYDADGNRTGAGGAVATYNARDQLVSVANGGTTTTYAYTGRGTTASVSAGSTTTEFTSDAFDEQVSAGTSTYSYDALGRLTTADSGGTSYTFGYHDASNEVVTDGVQTFERKPDGQVLSVGRGTGGDFAYLNSHGDLTASFTATGTEPTGSTAYDPYGRTTATTGIHTNLGYQGGWTDQGTGLVNAAARWYDPANGAFTSADTVANPPVPAVNANRYAYGNDDPLDFSDPTGHDPCSTYQEQQIAAAQAEADRQARIAQEFLSQWHKLTQQISQQVRAAKAAQAAAAAQARAEVAKQQNRVRNTMSSPQGTGAYPDIRYNDGAIGSAPGSGISWAPPGIPQYTSYSSTTSGSRSSAAGETSAEEDAAAEEGAISREMTQEEVDGRFWDIVEREIGTAAERAGVGVGGGGWLDHFYSVPGCGADGRPDRPTNTTPDQPTNPDSNPTGGVGPSAPLTGGHAAPPEDAASRASHLPVSSTADADTNPTTATTTAASGGGGGGGGGGTPPTSSGCTADPSSSARFTVDSNGVVTDLAPMDRGVTFFGGTTAEYYKHPGATLGRAGGVVFFMSEKDSRLICSPSDAAQYTGMAPQVRDAYRFGEPIYGVNFPTAGLEVRAPTASDAGGYEHFLEGGFTAVRLADDAGYLRTPITEFVTPGGLPVPKGSFLFKLGPGGEQLPIRMF